MVTRAEGQRWEGGVEAAREDEGACVWDQPPHEGEPAFAKQATYGRSARSSWSVAKIRAEVIVLLGAR